MNKDEMFVVNATQFTTKKNDVLARLDGVYSNNFGVTSAPLFCDLGCVDVFKEHGIGVFKCSFGFGGVITGITFVKEYKLP